MERHLLIAEDDIHVARAMDVFFRKRGVHVAIAMSLADARGLLETDTAWSGAVIDVNLPDGNGMDLLDAFRVRWWTTPVLVLTGELQATLANRAQRAGAEYAVKPLDIASLAAFAARLPGSGSDRDLERAVFALAERHRLTESETRIVLIATRGASRDELSTELDLSENTVKSQVRSLVRKCGQYALGDVVRHVWQQVSGKPAPR